MKKVMIIILITISIVLIIGSASSSENNNTITKEEILNLLIPEKHIEVDTIKGEGYVIRFMEGKKEKKRMELKKEFIEEKRDTQGYQESGNNTGGFEILTQYYKFYKIKLSRDQTKIAIIETVLREERFYSVGKIEGKAFRRPFGENPNSIIPQRIILYNERGHKMYEKEVKNIVDYIYDNGIVCIEDYPYSRINILGNYPVMILNSKGEEIIVLENKIWRKRYIKEGLKSYYIIDRDSVEYKLIEIEKGSMKREEMVLGREKYITDIWLNVGEDTIRLLVRERGEKNRLKCYRLLTIERGLKVLREEFLDIEDESIRYGYPIMTGRGIYFIPYKDEMIYKGTRGELRDTIIKEKNRILYMDYSMSEIRKSEKYYEGINDKVNIVREDVGKLIILSSRRDKREKGRLRQWIDVIEETELKMYRIGENKQIIGGRDEEHFYNLYY